MTRKPDNRTIGHSRRTSWTIKADKMTSKVRTIGTGQKSRTIFPGTRTSFSREKISDRTTGLSNPDKQVPTSRTKKPNKRESGHSGRTIWTGGEIVADWLDKANMTADSTGRAERWTSKTACVQRSRPDFKRNNFYDILCHSRAI